MNTFWKSRKVLVTGGTGFIGSHVVEKLVERKAEVTVYDRMKDGIIKNIDYLKNTVHFVRGDCTDISAVRSAVAGQDVIMNLAAHVGGIAYNQAHQASLLRDNMLIAATMLEAARLEHVERFLVVSSACVYPHEAKIPTDETEGFRGEPEPTNGGYGWGKRMAEKLGMYYAEQYGMKIGIVRPYNAYGPRDHFNPETSHVIPALIKRVLDGENPVLVWGSGRQSRAFLYVEDLAEGMITAIEKYPVADPINLGTDEEVSIADLIESIIKLSGAVSTYKLDITKPDGSPRRNSNNAKAKEKIGFVASTRLSDGLTKTINWYKHHEGV